MNSKLNSALEIVMDIDIERYKQIMNSEPKHVFSASYEKRKKEILSGNFYTGNVRYRHKSERKSMLIAMIVAIIMVLATAAVVVAIVKPQIFYKITNSIGGMDITYEQEGGKEGFQAYRPETPAEFQLIEEIDEEGYYSATYRDDDGHNIYYSQTKPSGQVDSVDSERHKHRVIQIEDRTVVVSTSKEDVLVTFDDGNYIFNIDGTCSEEKAIDMAEQIIKRKQ